jgi:dTDP-4-amino-4,6-dideoxygalactose transaminase
VTAAALAAYLGSDHAVLVNSGTSALELTLRAMALPPGSVVLVPALGCDAIVMSVWNAGCVPSFYDVDDALEARLTGASASAIVVVPHFGCVRPCLRPAAVDAYRAAGWRVIADCAPAVDARADGRHAGCVADALVLSFADTKQMPCGEGGAVSTDDPELAARVRLLATLGRESGEGDRRVVGRNLDMARPVARELEAHLVGWPARRRTLAARAAVWREALRNTPARIADAVEEVDVVPHKLAVRLDALTEEQRDAVRAWAITSATAQLFRARLPCDKAYNAGMPSAPLPGARAWQRHGLLLRVSTDLPDGVLTRDAAHLAMVCSARRG